MSSTARGCEGPSIAAAAAAAPPGPRLLVLLRHGESEWNLANRFTGWVDVDITEQGKRQATRAGALMRAHVGHGDRAFNVVFTSVLRRAIRTLHMAEDVMDLLHLEEVKSWRLNERHYGALQGLNKAQTAAKHGEEQVHIWRRSYATQPPALDPSDPLHPSHDPRYRGVDPSLLPATESLKDCVARCVPFWESHIAPALAAGRRVLVAAHGNSLRGLVKHLDAISDQDIMKLEIPVGAPLVYELDEQLRPVRRYYLGAGLVAAPPLGVALLLASGAGGAEEEGGGRQEGEGLEGMAAARCAMQALAKTLLHTAVTDPDHMRLVSPRDPAALAADGRAAEQLAAVPSTQALSSCSYLLAALTVGPDGGVDTAGDTAPGQGAAAGGGGGVGRTDQGVRAMEPSGPLGGGEVACGVKGGEGKAGAGSSSTSSSSGLVLRGLGELEAVAQHLEVERHVVVVLLLPGARAGGGGMQVQQQQVEKGGEEVDQLDLGLVSRRVAEVIGGRSKLLVAAPAGMGAGGVLGGGHEKGEQEQEEESLLMGGGRVWDAVPRAWRQGGRVHAAGCASAEEAEMVASVLSCATGSVWGLDA